MSALGSRIYYSLVSSAVRPQCPEFPEMPSRSGHDLIRPLIRDGETGREGSSQRSKLGLRGLSRGGGGGGGCCLGLWAVCTMFLLEISGGAVCWGVHGGREWSALPLFPATASEATVSPISLQSVTQATKDLAKIKPSFCFSPSMTPSHPTLVTLPRFLRTWPLLTSVSSPRSHTPPSLPVSDTC